MLGNLLSRIQTVPLARPRAVLVLSAAACVLAAWLGSGVEFRTSRSELAPVGDPDQRRWDELFGDYKASEIVIACLERAPGTGEAAAGEAERFAERLARRVTADPLVERVFVRLDVDWILTHALYLLTADEREAADEAVRAAGPLLVDLVSAASLAEANRRVAEMLDRGLEAGALPEQAASGAGMLEAYLRAQRAWIADPRATVESWTSRPVSSSLAGEYGDLLTDGFLKSHDGRTLFLLITPHSTDDSLPARRELLGRLREHVASVGAEFPGFHVAFTGEPAMTVEEMDTVRRDTWRTSLVAVLGVTLLTLAVFRWKSHAVLVLIALAVGVGWAFGAVRLELGYLNLITSAFLSTLVGVGVAYGIHPVSEYELLGAHTENPEQAVREAYRRTGPAVSAAGLTTAVAFFSILLMRFRGFAELGLVAGVGVLLCLLSMMVCLPAVLVLYGRRRRERDRQRRSGTVALDRLWLERGAGQVCRWPRATTAVALAVTAVCVWAATGLTFNTNILDLLPRDSEALEYQRKVALESDLSPVFNLVVANDLAELASMRDRAAAEPSIARFESALRFLPAEPERTRATLAGWDGWLDRLRLAERTEPFGADELIDSLEQLRGALERAADAAFTAGLGEVAGSLEQALGELDGCVEGAAQAGESIVADWNHGQQVLRDWMADQYALVERAVKAEPPSPETMPVDLRARFFTSSGKPLGMLYPVGSVFDPVELDRYVEASLRVSPEAIGFPFMFRKMSKRITAGFYRAVVAGAALVLLILLIDLRGIRPALLAALPLVMGISWTLGCMRWLGLSFNFANLVAIPLIVGVGIDNGVHVIHRVRLEGERGMGVVLRHTGRAILISSLTTMIGFGSLALASHRGLESLGLLLLLGVGSCLLASIVVLPNLLVALGTVPAPQETDDVPME